MSRIEAETALRLHPPGSYLIRNCESARKDYSLSLKYVRVYGPCLAQLNQCLGDVVVCFFVQFHLTGLRWVVVQQCVVLLSDRMVPSRSSHGYMHMRIQLTPSGHYILGQFSRPFASIADMVNYYTVNRLPIKGAEHVSLKAPLCEQLL